VLAAAAGEMALAGTPVVQVGVLPQPEPLQIRDSEANPRALELDGQLMASVALNAKRMQAMHAQGAHPLDPLALLLLVE
jgi:hypothetical protein